MHSWPEDKYKEVYTESKNHSRITGDWSIEALIKEALWREHELVHKNLPLFPDSYARAMCELQCRLTDTLEKNPDNPVDGPEVFKKLILAQKDKSQSLTSSSLLRDRALSELEKFFDIKNPIPIWSLP